MNYTEEDLNKVYLAGFEKGYGKGYSNGHDTGYCVALLATMIGCGLLYLINYLCDLGNFEAENPALSTICGMPFAMLLYLVLTRRG